MTEVNNSSEMREQLEAAFRQFTIDYSVFFRTLVLFAERELIIFTPKKTSWASQHWSKGVNKTTESESTIQDDISNLSFGDIVNIFNNVVYIKVLDEGHSTQRPSGFSHLVVQSVNAKAESLARDLSLRVYNNV